MRAPRSSRRIPRARRALALVAGAAAAVGVVSGGARSTGADPPPPIVFEDLSTVSGGPIDFGSPVSQILLSTCAFLDADGDGWDDILSLTGQGQPAIFMLNRPDGAGGRTFVPAPAGHGFDSAPVVERDGAGLAVADFDNDGDEDVFLGNAYKNWLPAGTGLRAMLVNDGSGRFTDVAPELGLAGGDDTCASAVFFDMEMDGDLDLLACNARYIGRDRLGDGVASLFRNTLAETGTLGFVEEAAARGVTEDGVDPWAILAFDKDGDGDDDLLISHDFGGKTQLFRNDGAGYFTDVTSESGTGVGDDADPSTFGDDAYAAMGIAPGDPDHDGDLDLYITDTRRNPLYLNDGSGRFTHVGDTRGVRCGTVTWGCNFADFDLDGWEDLYVAGGDVFSLTRPEIVSYLFRNDGGGATFTDVVATSGIRNDYPLNRNHGSAVADFDADGRPDLFVARAETEGASPYLYRNVTDTTGRRWLSVRLVGNGRTSNTSAVGAVVRVTPLDGSGAPIVGMTQMQQVWSAESRASRSSLRRHFGLGFGAESADVEVTWPRAGSLESRRQTFRGVPVDVRITIHEDPPEDRWTIGEQATAVVPDGRTTVVAVEGDGVPDPLVVLSVADGPGWVSVGEFDEVGGGGWSLEVSAPRVAESATTHVTLAAQPRTPPFTPGAQALSVHVVPAPRIVELRRRSSRAKIRIRGDHLEMAGLQVTAGGLPCKAGKPRVRPDGAGGTISWIDVTVPRAALRSAPKGACVVTVTDPLTGFSSSEEY